jgi:hypothetical protein
MKIAQGAGSICGALPLIFLAASAVSGTPARRGAEACEYLTVYADASIADETAGGREIAEPMRRAFLQMATVALPGLDLRIVQRPEDAYWTLTASSLVGPTSVGIFVELTGSIELQHHLYIAELDRDGFPYRGEVGGNHYIDILPHTEPERYRGEVERGVRLLWRLESEQVGALCAMSAKLRAEGWIGIEELQIELVEEMKRVRQKRARATRTKRLELDVEDPLPAGGSESVGAPIMD